MAKNTILIADDNPEFVRILKLSLESEGYQVLTACDGQDASNQISSSPPDLILLDVDMPKMDGLELSDTLKDSEQFKHIPIIMLSDLIYVEGEPMDRKGIFFLAKPFETSKLLSLISRLLVKD